MTEEQRRRLREIKTFRQLIAFLRDELDWPIEHGDDEDDLTFDWSDDLGLKDEERVGIKEIKQLRPLETGQPWGIFFVNFEKKALPIVILRRILNALVLRKRASANRAQRAAWLQRDLLFISAYGQENERQLTFAHFSEPSSELDACQATLRVLGWDDDDTSLKLDYVADTLKAKLTWPGDTSDLKAWRQRWSEAFELRHRQVIDTAEDLALRLADLAKRIRNRMLQVLPRESEHGELRKLLKGFQTALIHDLDEKKFADMYAQTITYGLFSAAVSRTVPGAGTAVHQGNVVDMVPVTNPFLREMLSSFLKAGGRRGKLDFDELGIQEVVDLLNDPKTHMEAVLRDFGNRTRGEDPVIHFYEEFIRAYDKKLKVQRGVFYTPQPVVSYIVRSAHEMLQTEFGLADGLADTITWGEMLKRHPGLRLPPLTDEPSEARTISPDEPFVQILDPATGTATFLVEVIDLIYRTLSARWKQQLLSDAQQRTAWNDYVPKHLLPRLHAFELMMAPYAIAHMKIGLKLAETGYRFGADERARIYLTNALEPWVKQIPLIGFEALAHEAAAVNEVKLRKRFTVVIGNPPYSISSWNTGEWITKLVEDYKRTVRGEESQIQALSNDYIKFLRFGEWHIERTGVGVLGLITGHGYLSGTQPRDLRNHLSNSFDRCYCLDLHGSIRRAGTHDSEDEPVFEIMTGVAILLAQRSQPHPQRAVTRLKSLTGRLEKKLAYLGSQTASHTALPAKDHFPTAPNFYFAASMTAQEVENEYSRYPDLPEIFGTGSRQADKEVYWATGFASQQDELAMSFTRVELEQKMADLANARSFEDLRAAYRVCTTNQWDFTAARDFARTTSWRQCVGQVSYRPFDRQWTVLHKHVLTILRKQVMSQLGGRERNIGLVSSRAVNDLSFAHCFVVGEPVDKIFISSKTSTNAYVFPLYFRHDDMHGQRRHPNFSPSFLALLADKLRLRRAAEHGLPAGLTPEDVFHYVYAVLHSPGYRSRYAELLKIDFPRLPLTGSKELFRALARLGGELAALHLLESPKLAQPIAAFIGGCDPVVEKVSWSRDTVWVNKAQTTGFQGVPEDVWRFHIGGYQVCEKWLKDRKGRTLTKDEVAHYHKIIVAVSETIRSMAEIDRVIEVHGGWPGAFQTAAKA